ncbi:MAG: carboxypeptidase-like regulatory domain-containing protein [Verrucomicrobiales bacterium]|nr:carboxypeptidase-like regulatory domain-containing protein [Verrucomicrobiales bacterium]
MKNLILAIILPCFFLVTALQAQDGIGSVSGTVFDDTDATAGLSGDDAPVQGAKVILIKLPGKEEVQVLLTGEDGTFNFGNVPFGEYEIRIEYISGLVVSTESFVVNGDTSAPEFQIPVITEASAPLYTTLRVVNPANTRGDEVSTFAP